MSAAQTLRAAAEQIRHTAERARHEAPSLTWEAEKVYDGIYNIDLGPSERPESDSYEMGVDVRMPREMAFHIETWNPEAAIAVADWLDDYASWLSTFGDFDRTPENTPALRLALQILGDAS